MPPGLVDGRGLDHPSDANFLITPGVSPAIAFSNAAAGEDINFPFLDGSSSNSKDHRQELRGSLWETSEAPGLQRLQPSPKLSHTNFSEVFPSELSTTSTSQDRSLEGGGILPTEAELRSNFGLPLQDVAVKMGLHLTALKKLCRMYGVMKWPHRKLAALEKKIAAQRSQVEGAVGAGDPLALADLAQLEQQREKIYAGNLDEEGCSPIDDAAPHGDAGADASGLASTRSSAAMSAGSDRKGCLSKGAKAQEDPDVWGGENFWTQGSLGDHDTEVCAFEGTDRPDTPGFTAPSAPNLANLEEENGSLRAISKYLMQERQDLLKKLETMSNQANNMKVLTRVLSQFVAGGSGSGAMSGLDEGADLLNEHAGGLDDLDFTPNSVGDMLIEEADNGLAGLNRAEGQLEPHEMDFGGGGGEQAHINWFATVDGPKVDGEAAAAEGALTNLL